MMYFYVNTKKKGYKYLNTGYKYLKKCIKYTKSVPRAIHFFLYFSFVQLLAAEINLQ